MTSKPMYGTSSISKKDVVDPARLAEAKNWIEQMLGEKVGDENTDFFEAIKDGIILCRVVNVIKAGTCKKFKASKMVFVQRSNIQIYIQGCKKLGVPETDTFETRDLYDRQRLSAVVQNLYALSAQSRKIGYQGPAIGVEYHTANKRNFSQETLNKSKSAVPGWAQGSIAHTTNAMDGYGIIKTKDGSHSGVQSVWEQGSKQNTSSTMDGYGIIKTKDGSHSGVQSVWEKGAKQVNNNTGFDSHGIIKNTNN
jgi:hypothetical protein